MMSWLYFILAILLEVGGTTALKFSQGLTRLLPSALMFALYALSFGVFARALRRIDVSVGYAIWSGLGTAAITAVGLLVFKEPLTAIKALSLALIIGGVIGLNLGGAH